MGSLNTFTCGGVMPFYELPLDKMFLTFPILKGDSVDFVRLRKENQSKEWGEFQQ